MYIGLYNVDGFLVMLGRFVFFFYLICLLVLNLIICGFEIMIVN